MATAYENNLSCAVCLELYDDPRILPCGHSYCLKCLLKLSKEKSNKSVITCPICQVESKCKFGGQASYTKNYELNSLVQSFISESQMQDSPAEDHCCELCDCDPATPAKRACVECEVIYCEKCFKTCHPMRGKFGKHKIVNADQPFKRRKLMRKYMYCNDCDIILSAAGICAHNKHDIVSLDKARSIFKAKLEEATGNIDLMQSTLNSSLDKSKEKLKAVVSMFEEIERDVASTKELVLSILETEIKQAEAAIDNLLPAVTAHRELQTRADTISFIEECQKSLRRSSLKEDFDDVLVLFERIERLTCCNASILKEIRKFEVCIIPVKVTIVPAASTSGKCLFDNMDHTERTELWVTTKVYGRDALSSTSVMVPTLTLPRLQFDHQHAGSGIRISRDGKKIAHAYHAAQLLGEHFPKCKKQMPYKNDVLANPHMTTGRLYWEVEVTRVAGEMCHFHFGVMASSQPKDCIPTTDDITWLVVLRCCDEITNINMMHADEDLHEEDSDVAIGQLTHRYGLLMDIDKRTLAVIDAESSKNIYTFTNMDMTLGFIPLFVIFGKMAVTMHAVDPDEIQRVPLLPFSTLQSDVRL